MISSNLIRLLEYTKKMSCIEVTFDVTVYGSAWGNKDSRVQVSCIPDDMQPIVCLLGDRNHHSIDGEDSMLEQLIAWIEAMHKQNTKPTYITVNGVEVPNLMLDKEPQVGTRYIIPNLTSVTGISYAIWNGSTCDKEFLALGIVYPDTEYGREAAKLRCDAMLIFNQ